MITNNDTPNYKAFKLINEQYRGPLTQEETNYRIEAEKVQVIRDIYGNDAERILNSYGTLAYDFLREVLENPFKYMSNYSHLITPKEAIDQVKNNRMENWANITSLDNTGMSTSSYKNLSLLDTRTPSPFFELNTGLTFSQGADKIAAACYKEFRKRELAEEKSRADAQKAQIAAAKKQGKSKNASASDTKNAIRSERQQFSKEGKIIDWLAQVNLQPEMKNTLIEKYGLDMAYKLVQAAMLHPAVAMSKMHADYRSSKNAIQYFVELDLNNENKTDLETLTGLKIEAQTTQTVAASTPTPQTLVANGTQTQSKGPQNKPIVLDSTVVTGTAPKLNVTAVIPQDVKLAPVVIKTPAEKKYDDLLAKINNERGRDAPDDVAARRAPEAGITLGDLETLGIDVTHDLRTVLKRMNKDKANSLIPEGGFKDKDVVISKELALALINYSLYYKYQMMKNGKER